MDRLTVPELLEKLESCAFQCSQTEEMKHHSTMMLNMVLARCAVESTAAFKDMVKVQRATALLLLPAKTGHQLALDTLDLEDKGDQP